MLDPRQMADEADVCLRTMLAALAGLPVRGRAGVRCARVLKRHGVVVPVIAPGSAVTVRDAAAGVRFGD